MSFESRLHDDLHRASLPHTLVPPPGLADTVLAGNRRRAHRTVALAAGGAVAAGLTIVGATTLVPGPGSSPVGAPPSSRCSLPFSPQPLSSQSSASTTGDFPRPGGGPRVVDVFRTQRVNGGSSYLLDPSDGTYHELPWPVTVSPDGTIVAIANPDGRVGIAGRSALIEQGSAAVAWLDLPPANAPLWSPDGTALVATSIDKDLTPGQVSFVAHRYDLASGTITDTVIPDGPLLIGSQAGWAPDSQRYLALYREPGDAFVVGSPRYVNPDGTAGSFVDVPGGLAGGAEAYSPSRQYLILDASMLMTDEPSCSFIVDMTTGAAATELPRDMTAIGWYDDSAFLAVAEGQLQVVDLADLTVVKRIDTGGYWPAQFGPSPASARDLGF